MPAHWTERAHSRSEHLQLVSTQEKDWVCLRYLHTHSLKPVCSADIHSQDDCGISWESTAFSRCVSISLLIQLAGRFMVVSLQDRGWNGSGEPLDTDFLGFQMLCNYMLAFFLHWFCLHSQAVDWHAVWGWAVATGSTCSAQAPLPWEGNMDLVL